MLHSIQGKNVFYQFQETEILHKTLTSPHNKSINSNEGRDWRYHQLFIIVRQIIKWIVVGISCISFLHSRNLCWSVQTACFPTFTSRTYFPPERHRAPVKAGRLWHRSDPTMYPGSGDRRCYFLPFDSKFATHNTASLLLGSRQRVRQSFINFIRSYTRTEICRLNHKRQHACAF